LIQGETGVGKELVARAIHDAGGRAGEFVAVNCGAVSDGVVHSELFGHARGAFSGADAARTGLVDSARGGTLFLDEIGDASPALQASLLRLLEEREFRPVGSDEVRTSDARVIAATHVALEQAVAKGRFRRDLFGRLERLVIAIPPLRERREDIARLAIHFAERAAQGEVTFARSLMVALLRASWPQNVRQLRAVVEQALLEAGGPELRLSDALKRRIAAMGDAPESLHHPDLEAPPAGAAAARPERPSAAELRDLLLAQRCNIRVVAQALGVSRNSLYRWIDEAQLDLAELRRAPKT
jgi:DNA-binding NtrC family response regulator